MSCALEEGVCDSSQTWRDTRKRKQEEQEERYFSHAEEYAEWVTAEGDSRGCG